MAVYTEVTDDALRAFLREYAIGDLVAFRGIAEGVENSNYSLKTSTGDFILTLYEKRVDPAELPWFLGLMEHLAKRGIVCPLPVAGRDGAALAALHRAGADYAPERRNALGPSGWAPLLARGLADGGAAADAVHPGLGAELQRALAGILAAWPGALPRGHIHADLFPDNVFFLDGRLSGLIDFYFAATDLLAYDIAVCLNAWCFEPDLSFNVTKARAMLRAYAATRPLAAAELSALPVLCQGAAIRFALTRLYDWINTPPGALVTRKDPMEYVRRLRFFLTAPDVFADAV